MRATATGLAAVAVLGLAGSLAHADPFFGCPPGGCVPCNPVFYAANGQGCWYGPNYCFQGPCLPPSPFNGLLPYRGPGGPYPGGPGMAPGLGGYPPGPGGPGGPPGFPMNPFAHGPRDYFMYGQTYND